MRLSTFKKICLTLMGVGVVSSLVSVGTFATFTATTTNPTNTFAAGTLTLQDLTGAVDTLGTNPNKTGTDARGTTACNDTSAAANLIASACTSLLQATKVAVNGLEPGQYVQGTIKITNSGTLPATLAMQVQNVTTLSGNGNNALQITQSATGCPTDVTGVTIGSRAVTGPQIDNSNSFAACSDIGNALNITIQDAGSSGGTVLTGAGDTQVATGVQCVYGGDGWVSGASAANGTNSAPVTAFSQTYVASGSKAGATYKGNCDPIANNTTTTSLNNLGTASSAAAGQISNDKFGTSAAHTGFAGFASALTKLIYIPGSSSKTSTATTVPQWLPGESHTFTVTVALPDTGTLSITDKNNDTYSVSKDNQYQDSAATFDLIWLAVQ